MGRGPCSLLRHKFFSPLNDAFLCIPCMFFTHFFGTALKYTVYNKADLVSGDRVVW